MKEGLTHPAVRSSGACQKVEVGLRGYVGGAEGGPGTGQGGSRYDVKLGVVVEDLLVHFDYEVRVGSPIIRWECGDRG